MAGNKKISELNPPSSLNGNEQVELLQVGKNVRQTLTAIKDWIVSTLSFNFISLMPQVTPPTYSEGLIYYDDTKKALTVYDDQSDTALNLGEELIAPIVINNTGSQIDNGTPVYLSGVSGGYYTIDLADSAVKEKCRKVYIATQDIANGSTGRVAKIGEVGGLNLSAYSVNDVLYLDTPSGLTDTQPDDGKYLTQIGLVKSNSGTDDILYVDVKTSDLTVEVTDTNGFPPDQRIATTISFVDGTRTFTIAPTGSDFHFYELGDKYSKTSSENIVIANTTGNHIIYYDGGVLSEVVNPSESQAEEIILNHAIVSYIYWNSTSAKGEIVQCERHGISMSPQTHLYLHQRFGSFYISGLALNDFVIGNGSLNTHAQFSIATGVIKDEDIAHTLNAIASTTGLKYYYRSGANGDFVSGANAGYSFPVGATPLPQYNEFTGATWQLTELTSGDYMNLHIFANGAIDGNPIVMLGTAEYTQLSAASAGQADELTTILANLPLPEFVLIGSVILEGKTSFTNTNNCRVVQNSEGENYTNWTVTEISQGQAPSNHNNLGGLELAGTSVTWGHISNSTPLQLPELTTTERDAIASPNAGMKIYNTTLGKEQIYDGSDWVIYFQETIVVACSDETTVLTTGTAKATFRMPIAMTLTGVRASLTGAGSTSGTTTVDINESGTTVLSTKLTIDFGEKTSTTAATAAVISDSVLADDSEITIDIDAVTGGADETGLKVYLIGYRS